MLFVSYALRSLRARFRANATTLLSIALFVAGGTLGVAYYASLHRLLVSSAPPDNIIVLAEGTPVEADSQIKLESAQRIATVPGIKLDGKTPLVARELVSSIQLNTTDFAHFQEDSTIRGIDDRSMQVHHATIVEGVAPQPGTLEAVLGRRLARQHPELPVGSSITTPTGAFKITGTFAADDGPYEDEAWVPRAALELYLNTKLASSLTLVAETPAGVPAVVAGINQAKQLGAHAASLAAFRAKGAGLSEIARTVLIMLVLLAIVGMFAITMTMNASVAIRLPELAAMAAIGIRKSVLARMIVIESTLLGVAGAAVGVAIAELLRRAIGTVTLGESPVALAAVAAAPLIGLAMGVAVGVLGGLLPALAVRRLSILEALR